MVERMMMLSYSPGSEPGLAFRFHESQWCLTAEETELMPLSQHVLTKAGTYDETEVSETGLYARF